MLGLNTVSRGGFRRNWADGRVHRGRLVRLLRRLRRRSPEAPADIVSLPEVSPMVERLLLRLAELDQAMLRTGDLPFGSSVLLAASKAPA